ncbi:MAG: PPOX class F420-dependent oxidoreductase [Ornithinibacter sp.]
MTTPEGADGPSPASGPHPLSTAKYASLTTFRRSGAPVSTPVWIAPAVDGSGRLCVITVDDTGKTKRLAHTTRVELRACDMRGRVAPDAPTYAGTARVVRGADDIAQVRAAVVAKYGMTARFSDLLEKVTGLVGIRRNPRAGIVIEVEPEQMTTAEPDPMTHAGADDR